MATRVEKENNWIFWKSLEMKIFVKNFMEPQIGSSRWYNKQLGAIVHSQLSTTIYTFVFRCIRL